MKPAFKTLLIVAAVVLPAGIIFMGSSGGSKAPPLPARTPGAKTPIWANFTEPTSVPKTNIDYVPPVGTTFVGFYKYRDVWIRIDEFTDSVIEDEVAGVAHTEMRYKARFQWTVMVGESNLPLGTQAVTTEGTSWTVFDGPLNDKTQELLDEAREEAITAAVNLAAQWIVASGTRPIIPGM